MSRHKSKDRQQRRREARIEHRCEPICVECGKRAKLVGAERVYPHRDDLSHKRLWLCACGAYVGCHVGTDIPMGFPAGPETRQARSRAHAAFDPLWRAKAQREGIAQQAARLAGYAWLALKLAMPPERCHIAMMSRAEAERVEAICAAYRQT